MTTNVLVTGCSSGIGYETVREFLKHDDMYVIGLDCNDCTIKNDNFEFHKVDVGNYDELPNIYKVNILINNAGIQSGSFDEIINTNVKGVINCTEKYAISNYSINSVVNMASVSAHNGAEFPYYVASKGAVLAYTKWTAKQLAPRALCNSISFGGVSTPLNDPVMYNPELWNKIMDETPMKKWIGTQESAQWVYFIGAINKSMTAQDIIIDNGEMYNHNFIW